MVNNTTFTSINYNDYYADGTGGVLGTTTGATGGNQTTLAAWKAAVPADAASGLAEPAQRQRGGSPPICTSMRRSPASSSRAVPRLPASTTTSRVTSATGRWATAGPARRPTSAPTRVEGIPQDLTPPAITYALLPNSVGTTTCALTNVVITDASGVNGSAGTRPRVYYKKFGDANAWGDNTSATDGWKYAEANGSASPFDFTIDYSLIYGGSVAGGDTIQYFVVAQDWPARPTSPSTRASSPRSPRASI